MADIDAYKDKFSESGQRVLETALGESKKREQNYVSIEHILHAIAFEEDDLFTSTMRDLAVDPRSVKLLIEKRMEAGRQHSGKGRVSQQAIKNFFDTRTDGGLCALLLPPIEDQLVGLQLCQQRPSHCFDVLQLLGRELEIRLGE